MRKIFINIIILLLFLFQFKLCLNAQSNQYEINIGEDIQFIEDIHFSQGTNINPAGEAITLNNYFLMIDGKPVLPVMGEIHYSRYPKEEWEEAILKMKANGINIIASYSFWMHHEENEGEIRFDDNRDVRYFLELCKKHDLMAFVRIGPWCHGECRNGGYPDWYNVLINKKRMQEVSEVNRPYIERWYKALHTQFEGLYYKDGGPIVAMQVDNEVRSRGVGDKAYQYQRDLKKIAVEAGIDVPIYTATGWSGPVPEDDMMPTYGGYPAAPWAKHTKDLGPSANYLFKTGRLDPNIGTDLGLNAGPDKEDRSHIYRHPFFTVEMGGGNQISYHRRPSFVAEELIALVYTRLGVGANSMGYYVFHGGQHPLSWNKEYSTSESKLEGVFPYANDYPRISYDFLSPLSEWGFMRDYYHDFRLIHLFLNDYGDDLASMHAVTPINNPDDAADNERLRYSVRSRNGAGYVFINNFVRHLPMDEHTDVSFKVKMPMGDVQIPDHGINIKDSVYAVFPFNHSIEGVTMKYATAHPFAKINAKTAVNFFYSVRGIPPEYKFASANIKSIKLKACSKSIEGKYITIRIDDANADAWFTIKTKAGKKFTIYNMSYQKARHAYKFKLDGNEHLVISDKLVFQDETKKEFEVRSLGDADFNLQVYPDSRFKHTHMEKSKNEGLFTSYSVNLSDAEGKAKLLSAEYIQLTPYSDFVDYTKQLGTNPPNPQHTVKYEKDNRFLTYELTLPSQFPDNLSNILLELDYYGNTAAVYADGIIIADDYYSGAKMPLGLNRLKEHLKDSKFIFQITPLLKDYKIWFEPGTKLDFVNKSPGELRGMKLTPEYKILIKY